MMRIALMIEGQEGVTWEQWLALGTAAESADLDGLFRSDHYRSITRGSPAGSLDAWTTLAAIAARTERLRLGTMVSPVTFRPASLLAKAVTTVDHISNGRVELGIGAGWFEAEHETYGFPFLTTRERLDELDNQLAEITHQWTDAPDVWPKPVQHPRPPIIVGGRAKPRTVRAAVRFADEYNTPFVSPEEAAAIREKTRPLRFSVMTGFLVGQTHEEMRERAQELYSRRAREQSFDDWLAAYAERCVVGSVDEVVERLRDYERAGCDRVMLQHLLHTDLEPVRLIGRELAPALA